MKSGLELVSPKDARTHAAEGLFSPPPAGHFWLEHLVHALADATEVQTEWQLITLSNWEPEILALFAVNSRSGYAMFHSVNPQAGGELLAACSDVAPLQKVLGNYATLTAAIEVAGLQDRLIRDHREIFLILPCGHLRIEPDWRYRLAGPEDIGRLIEYNARYNAERRTTWSRDWNAAIASRSVYVRERDGVISACLLRGAALPPLVSFGGTFTFPEYRGLGEATMLVANFCAEMALWSFDVCLIVDDDNSPALQAYSKVGFTPNGLYRTTYFSTPH